ncbi:MAG: MBL fold metallo-hydrolase, partial [Gammaproteobacteria bacterium]|nr:MBL fold metallo-hydrolase [Gammaproteobacteria bacterium]
TQPISIEELPAIDVVLISHDHYDHLDYRAVKELSDTVDTFLVPLGVKAHLQRWGVDSDKIVEHDWYQTTEYSGVSFTQTPSRHFSGRGITNRFSTLWGSWVVKSDSMSVFFSGDSGYYDEFKRIGERYGPFDIAFMENGAYSVLWNQIHMFPEEAVQASIDLKATLFFPIHWGKYDLAFHTWTEPANRAMAAARENDVTMVSPLIGDVFNLSEYPSTPWWQKADTD